MQSHQINWDIYQRSCLGIQFCLDKWKLFWISAKSNSKHYKFNINLKLFESNATFHHPAFSYFVKVNFDSHVWHVELFEVVQHTRFLNCHNGWVKMIHQIWSIWECQGKWNFICTGKFFCTFHLLISNILVFESLPQSRVDHWHILALSEVFSTNKLIGAALHTHSSFFFIGPLKHIFKWVLTEKVPKIMLLILLCWVTIICLLLDQILISLDTQQNVSRLTWKKKFPQCPLLV